MFARLVEHAFENPARSGGLLVMALTATAIVSNALFLQSGTHPEPLFTTRSAGYQPAAEPTPPPAARAAVARADHDVPELSVPPLPRLGPGYTASIPADAIQQPVAAVAPEPMPAELAPPATVVVDELSPAEILLTAIQRELARLGLYSGAIDGLMGQRTAAAIVAFETAAGMKATGQPSATLLKAIKQPNAAAIIAQPLPAGHDAQAAELDRREKERARLIAEQEKSVAASRAAANTRIAQAALNRIGYGPLPTDGQATPEIEEAIRRFELDNGMTVTGKANDALISRLIAIGAVKPG